MRLRATPPSCPPSPRSTRHRASGPPHTRCAAGTPLPTRWPRPTAASRTCTGPRPSYTPARPGSARPGTERRAHPAQRHRALAQPRRPARKHFPADDTCVDAPRRRERAIDTASPTLGDRTCSIMHRFRPEAFPPMRHLPRTPARASRKLTPAGPAVYAAHARSSPTSSAACDRAWAFGSPRWPHRNTPPPPRTLRVAQSSRTPRARVARAPKASLVNRAYREAGLTQGCLAENIF